MGLLLAMNDLVRYNSTVKTVFTFIVNLLEGQNKCKSKRAHFSYIDTPNNIYYNIAVIATVGYNVS